MARTPRSSAKRSASYESAGRYPSPSFNSLVAAFLARKNHPLGEAKSSLRAWSNLHAGPDFAKASSGRLRMLVRRDAHAEVEKLTADSMPAPFHFSNFEESVLDRSGNEADNFLLRYLSLTEQNRQEYS